MQPDRDLDRELRDLGPSIEYPPTPDLAGSVRSRLEADDGAAAPPARGPQLWWIAAAAIVLLVALPVFASILNTMGGAFSGGAAAGGGGGGAGVAESEKQGAADVAEPTQPSLAMESGASSSAGSGSAAACATPAPILEARPSRGAPGNEFSIRGRYFVAGFSVCDDTGSGSPAAAQTVPARDVRVEFVQGKRTWELGSVEADKGSRIATELEVPEDARPGRAIVRATYGQGPPESPYGRTSVEARFFVLE